MEQVIDKKRFAASVRTWINHKKTIASVSIHEYYKSVLFNRSLREVNDLLQLVKRDCSGYNFSDLCKLVVRNETQLRNILPTEKNPSFKSSLEKLENLLTLAKSNLK